MRLLYYILISFFIFSCQPTTDNDDVITQPSKGERSSNRDDEDRPERNNPDRSREITRLKPSGNVVISATLEDRYSGYSYSEYGGRECGESSSCEDLCDDIFSSKYRKKCYKSPERLIKELEDGLFELINISEVDSVSIGSGFIGGVLQIDKDIVLDLVEDKMSEGDLRSFLAWVAVNEDVSEAFMKEDRSSKILKAAFGKLGSFQKDVSRGREVETALNLGLIGDQDTFLYLTELEDNPAGFQVAYDLLEKACSTKECKMEVLCSREDLSVSSRSRIFGGRTTCRTSTIHTRRSRAGGTCYLQGASVWSLLDGLIEDKEIRDNDFKETPLTVEVCNDFCGRDSRTNEKCSRVL